MSKSKGIDGRVGAVHYSGGRPSQRFDMPAAIQRLHRILEELYGDDEA